MGVGRIEIEVAGTPGRIPKVLEPAKIVGLVEVGRGVAIQCEKHQQNEEHVCKARPKRLSIDMSPRVASNHIDQISQSGDQRPERATRANDQAWRLAPIIKAGTGFGETVVVARI
jgi:hypothetical protein